MDDLVPIGEFSERCGLSPKRLRTYAACGLLIPEAVDSASGYRYYSPGQVREARLIDALRTAGVPLADIVDLLLDPSDERLDVWSRRVQTDAEQRQEALDMARRLLPLQALSLPPIDYEHSGSISMRGAGRDRHGPLAPLVNCRNGTRRHGMAVEGDEPACKPGSVTRAEAHADGHPSGTTVAGGLVRSTRRHRTGSPPAQGPRRTPSRPCSGWGLPSRPGHPGRWCALTAPFHPYCRLARRRCGSGLFSVALSRGSPRVGVTDHPALWSPDFPRPPKVPRPSGQLVPRRKATPPCGTAWAAA